ncbi:hypothetical protein V8G54_017736 [Vigna mungo]|uniref:E2 binding domain-containing protein n=1 Tax=Vigna mungo TaxID=3915 RepID=A0AAQ3NQK6_VIGMU
MDLLEEHPKLRLSKASITHRGKNLYMQAPPVLEEMTRSNLSLSLFNLMGKLPKDVVHVNGMTIKNDQKESMGLQIWIQLEEHNLRHHMMCWCLEFLGSIRIIIFLPCQFFIYKPVNNTLMQGIDCPTGRHLSNPSVVSFVSTDQFPVLPLIMQSRTAHSVRSANDFWQTKFAQHTTGCALSEFSTTGCVFFMFLTFWELQTSFLGVFDPSGAIGEGLQAN